MQVYPNSSQQQSSPARIPRNPSQSSSPNLVHALPPLPPPSFPPSKPTCDSQLPRKMCPSVPVRRSSLDRNNTTNYSRKNTEHIREEERSSEISDANTVIDEVKTPTNEEILLTESKVKTPVKSCPEYIC